MSNEVARLEGGPHDGNTFGVQSHVQIIQVPYLLPESLPFGVITLPRYRWWHRLLRRPVPHPPDPPTFRNLTYRRTNEPGNIFRYEPVNGNGKH